MHGRFIKRVFIVLFCFAGVVFLLFAVLELLVPPPFKGEIVDTWQTENTPFKIRVNAHIERGAFMSVIGGAYYDFQSAAADSDDWRQIMTFRHDDPIKIPRQLLHFADDNVASVFMGWKYAVTTDGGASWRVYNMWDFLPND